MLCSDVMLRFWLGRLGVRILRVINFVKEYQAQISLLPYFLFGSAKLLRFDEFQAQGCLVAVDLLHIEFAHELNGLSGDNLAGDQDREAGGIRNHEVCRYGLAAPHQIVDLLAVELYMCAVILVVSEKEGCAHVAFVSLAPRVVAERVMEAAEVWKVRHVGDEALDARVKRRLLIRVLRERAIQFTGDVCQHLDEVGDVTTGVIDVSLKKDAVARGLVKLDVKLAREHSLERCAIKAGGTAQQGDASGIQDELVASPGVIDGFPAHTIGMKVLESTVPVFFRHHLGIGGNGEVFGDERMLVYLATQDQGEFDSTADQLIPFQFRLATGDVEGGD